MANYWNGGTTAEYKARKAKREEPAEGTYDNENMVRFDLTPAASGNARGSGDGWEDSDPWSQGRKARDDAPSEAASPWGASMMAFNEKFGTPAEAASATPAIVGTLLQDFKDKFGGSAVGGVGFDSGCNSRQ